MKSCAVLFLGAYALPMVAAVVAVSSVAGPLPHPACLGITCADISCNSPFTLRRLDDQCCPVCWAPDDVIGLDRHTALAGENPYATHPAPQAPWNCDGVKCFSLHCGHGYTKGHVQGRCCHSCVPGR